MRPRYLRRGLFFVFQGYNLCSKILQNRLKMTKNVKIRLKTAIFVFQ